MFKKIIALTTCVSLYAASAFGAASTVETFQARNYRLYNPTKLNSSQPGRQPGPLLIVLHGGLGNAEDIEAALGMNEIADHYGFKIAYLNGTGGLSLPLKNKRTWNADGCCGIADFMNINDVTYITDFIAKMRSTYSVTKVYMIGHSNGAMMAYRFICEKPKAIDAMVSIAGSKLGSSCSPTKTRILEIHGLLDNNVPYAGGIGSQSLTQYNFKSVNQSAIEMIAAGADHKILPINGGGHHLGELYQIVKTKYNINMAEVIGHFLN